MDLSENMKCSICDYQNPKQSKFCGKCGNGLLSKQKNPSNGTTERRQLTVMFCDLVGSTNLSQQLDPEEFHHKINQYQQICEEVVDKLDGYVAQFLGDGVLIYFGYPKAHEDDARRATKAAVDIIKNLNEISIPNIERKPLLKVRIGIHTGNVVIGDMGRSSKREQLAIGDVPNIAALIQKQAKPNQILVSQDTHQLVKGFYTTRKSKAILEHRFVYTILGENVAQTRFEANAVHRLTPLAGRDIELRELHKLWEQVKKRSQSKVCLISGEAGIGKSRLAYEFVASIVAEPTTVLKCQCWETAKNSPLSPILNLLERMLEFEEKDSQETKIKKVEKLLRKNKINLKKNVPILTNLLSIPLNKKYQLPIYSPEKLKQDSMRTFINILGQISKTNGLVLIVEDLHWADPSTVDFLTMLINDKPDTRTFSLFTFRPEFKSEWKIPNQIDLKYLDKKNSEEIVSGLIRKKSGSDKIVKDILARCDGIPLYLEEITKTMIEVINIDDSSIPITLNDSLMSRLDSLGQAKEIAQISSVIGREFDLEILKSVLNINVHKLTKLLEKLLEDEIIYILKPGRYIFKHALIQDAAYESIPKKKKKGLHNKLAAVLENHKPIIDHQPALLAYHYEKSGNLAQSISYLKIAGNLALAKSSPKEAKVHLQRGLDLLKNEDSLKNKDSVEVELLAPLQLAAFANSFSEIEYFFKVSERLILLCQKLNQLDKLLFAVHIYVSMLYTIDVNKSLYHTRLSNKIAKKSGSIKLEVHSAISYASIHAYIGNYPKSIELYNKVLDMYDRHKLNDSGFFVNANIEALGQSSWCIWQMGYVDIGLARSKKSLKLSRESRNPADLAFASVMFATNHLVLREYRHAEMVAREGLSYCDEIGLIVYKNLHEIILVYLGLLLNNDKHRDSLELKKITESKFYDNFIISSIFQKYIVESYINILDYRHALELIESSFKRCKKAGNSVILAQLYRLKGDLLLILSQKNMKKAEQNYIESLNISRKQKTRFFELETINSYSKLLLKQGREKEAKRMLSRLVRWFDGRNKTEIPELNEANNLILELK